MPLQVLPDALLVAREAMLAQTTITGSVVQQRIYWGIPASPVYPLWALSLVDDIEFRPETTAVRLQVDVWGAGPTAQNLADAKASAALLRAVARDLNGNWPNGKIRNCVAPTIVPSPDPSGRVRFVVDLIFELNQ